MFPNVLIYLTAWCDELQHVTVTKIDKGEVISGYGITHAYKITAVPFSLKHSVSNFHKLFNFTEQCYHASKNTIPEPHDINQVT
jgi:hypothetical protein